MRRYAAADEAGVLELINADRLPGQPQTTPTMLAQALIGKSPVDSGWWAELDIPHTDVVAVPTGRVVGVVSFSARDLWRYIHRRLDARLPDQESPLTEISPSTDPTGWQLTLRESDGMALGEAIIGEPVDGIGVLWWITIAPPARRRGLGRTLLNQCCAHLAAISAREIIAYVDDGAPPSDTERDRTAANRLYDQAGFTEIDRLHSFLQRP